MRLPSLLLVGLVLLFARGARADERDDKAWSTPFVIGARLEAFPVLLQGFNGVTFEVAPSRMLSIELGAGEWFYAPAGLLTLHLQAPFGRAAFGLEAGLLAGSILVDGCQYDVAGDVACGDDTTILANGHALGAEVRDALFGRVGASLAWRTAGGRMQMRFFAGASPLLHRRIGIFVDEVTHRELPGGFAVDTISLPTLLYAGMSLGYGFRP